MRFCVDHDYHIHSQLSICSGDSEQTPERILQYAKDHGLKSICLTDHFWDERVEKLSTGWASGFYQTQNFSYVCKSKPLPKADGIEFLFGCETEMDMHGKIGISKERLDEFAFIIVATTHMHMDDFSVSKQDFRNPERLAKLWVERIDALLDKDLPFKKMGLAHPTCFLINEAGEQEFLHTLELIDEGEMRRVLCRLAQKGLGFEINYSDACLVVKHDVVKKIFTTAKECGCKFYLGSDAHHPKDLDKAPAMFERVVEELGLTEEDKFHVAR